MKIDELIKISIFNLGTKKKLAFYLGCNERTVYRWISGDATPSSKYVEKMLAIIKRA